MLTAVEIVTDKDRIKFLFQKNTDAVEWLEKAYIAKADADDRPVQFTLYEVKENP